VREIIVETLDASGHSEEAMSIEDAEAAFNRAHRNGSAVFAEAGGQQLGNVPRGGSLPADADKITIVPPTVGG
jgi:hypothetical protein